MYTSEVGAPWVGRNFGELLMGASNATVIGLRHPDGTVELSPSPDTIVSAGDFVIGIAEDDSTFIFDRAPVAWQSVGERRLDPVEKTQERTLIVGWSGLAPLIAQEIEIHVAPGSELHVMVNEDLHDVSRISQSMSLTQQSLVIPRG